MQPEVTKKRFTADEFLRMGEAGIEPQGYRTSLMLYPGDSISPAAFPDVVFKVEDLLG
jgi:hypothetical protein